MSATLLVSHADSLEAWNEREAKIFDDVFAPAAHLRPSEWAPENRVISKGPRAGDRWVNEQTPYLVEIMDFVADPWARLGCVRKGTRVGYTEGVIHNDLLFTIHHDPCTIAIVQPSDSEAEAYSKEDIEPLFEHNGEVADKLAEGASAETMTFKRFANGYLLIMGSAADKNLRRRSLKRVLIDEVDAMKREGPEGDPILRLMKRTDDYPDGVVLAGSTPTKKGESLIDPMFEKSDQRFWHVCCPHCDELQVLRWGAPGDHFGIKWDREVSCKGCGVEFEGDAPETCACGSTERHVKHLPETAYYECEYCGEAIDEADKPDMIRGGRWIPTKPENSYPGWAIPSWISLFFGARWGKLAAEFLSAQDDPEALQVWVNTVAGEAWEERGKKVVDFAKLEDRAVAFVGPGDAMVEVPDGVGVLCAGVDVQDDRIELLICGYGIAWETWDISHQRIYGDSREQNTWARLDHLLLRRYRHVSGAELPVLATMIDSGHATDTVYSFVAPREYRNVWACKGDDGRPKAPPVSRSNRRNRQGVMLWTVGTFTLTDAFLSRLKVKRPGPRYVHLRRPEPKLCNGFDAEYFAQLGAEQKVPRRVKGEKRFVERFVQVRARNEGSDLHRYADGAYHGLGAGVHDNIAEWVEAARTKPRPRSAAVPDDNTGSGGGWVDSWRNF